MEQAQYKKIGFWAVFGIVVGSQVGSGIFMAPVVLAPYGILSFYSYIIAAIGAMALALVFAKLCSIIPKTGGPHTYVNAAFGPFPAFFTGWCYWVISWVSSLAVVKSCIGYLIPIIGQQTPELTIAMEIFLLLTMTLLNLYGLSVAGVIEFFLTLLKIVPLVILPVIALFFFKMDNIQISESVQQQSLISNLGHVTLIVLWGFIGLETGTTTAGSVKNPEKTIPKATAIGTLLVALLYFVNNAAIMGAVPATQLINSTAPYSDVVKNIFGGTWYLIISFIAFLVCLSTLNAWILSSGQVAMGVAQDKLMPKVFGVQNKNGSPYFSILMTFIGGTPLIILTYSNNFAHQMNMIIDFSVTAFLFVYMICVLSYFKILIKRSQMKLKSFVIGAVALLFCSWIIYNTPLNILLMAFAFVLTGIPVYIWHKASSKKEFEKIVKIQ